MTPCRRSLAAALVGLLAVAASGAPARAEGAPGGVGVIRGAVTDASSGAPVEGVEVAVVWPAPEGGEPRREFAFTDADGAFQFEEIPAGSYSIRFRREGYRASSMTNFVVRAGEVQRADFPLPPLPAGMPEAAPDIEEFVVIASPLEEILAASRQESDQLINTLSAEDISKFAASDVADALKFVPGVNVVEGQFAVIRGLEDRYSSTLYNGAPVPSPDPDRQSVQLDLFPSDVVSDLVVAKTFAGDLPGNSSGGSIDVHTLAYPEEFQFRIGAGTGFNSNAREQFIEFEDGNPVGGETGGAPLEREFGGSIGGRGEILGRELRFKAVANREIDYETALGEQQGREPKLRSLPGEPFPSFVGVRQSGGLSLGRLDLTDGVFDLTTSEKAVQETGYLGFGVDVDGASNHRIDASVFFTQKSEELVQLEENGTLPNFDYSALTRKEAGGDDVVRSDFLGFSTLSSWIARGIRESRTDPPGRGQLWFTSVAESNSFLRERDLVVYQLNGDHRIEWTDWLEGLHVSWAANLAETTQDEVSRGTRFFFEPDDDLQPVPLPLPVSASQLGSGRYAANSTILVSTNDIDENQTFARFDVDYETPAPIGDVLSVRVGAGGWYEEAERDVDSSYLETPSINPLRCAQTLLCQGSAAQFVIFGDTPQEMGRNIGTQLSTQPNGELIGLRLTANQSSREIWAWNAGLKLTFWEDLDLLGGVRGESIVIESLNQPFINELRFGSPEIFPTRYLLFDRLDNAGFLEVATPPPAGTIFNDQILGLDVELGPCFTSTGTLDPTRQCVDLRNQSTIEARVNGRIDETRYLPAAGLAWRPIAGLSLRGAYSQTVARPSFREIGYYVSIEPGTLDLVVGNPQLQLSDVESWDARAEYFWGEFGDLAALSLFYKTIDAPIESLLVRNPLNAEASGGLFRTFFNNPNQATLWGIETEARKSFDFLGVDFLNYLSLGGNFTYIDAEVGRTEAELARSQAFFGTLPGDVAVFSGLADTRRLFGQPEWIGNVDLSFDHPDWGTRVTLAFFAISDVLDAAGVATIGPAGQILSMTLDRYIDSYNQLDLIASQTFRFEVPLPGGLALPSDFTLKVRASNLTDTTRRIVYDPNQTVDRIAERSFKIGRDYTFSVLYSLYF